MKTTLLSRFSNFTALLALGLLACGAGSAAAQDTWIYTALTGAPPGTMSPQFSILPAGGYAVSTGWSHASGLSVHAGSYYASSVTPGMGFSIQCTADTLPGSGYTESWELDLSVPVENAASSLTYDLSISPGFHLGKASTTITQSAANMWQLACYFTSDVDALHPEVTFTYASGLLSGTSRSYADAFKFTRFLTPVPEPSTLVLLALGAGALVLRRRRA
jgi:hypothetical protein